MTTHVNKVHHVTTIDRIAEHLGKDEDWLWNVANEMEMRTAPFGSMLSAKRVSLAFTDFAIESLHGLIKMYKETTQALGSAKMTSMQPMANAYRPTFSCRTSATAPQGPSISTSKKQHLQWKKLRRVCLRCRAPEPPAPAAGE